MKNQINILNGKTVLVTGGTGFIGSHLVRKLIQNNVDVIVLSRKEPVNASDYKSIKCDISDSKSLENIKDKISDVDYVIHLASLIPDTLTEDSIEANIQQNVMTAINLIKNLSSKTKSVIYSSTIDVYGIPNYNPIDENHPANPSTNYGISKLTAEKIMLNFLENCKLITIKSFFK